MNLRPRRFWEMDRSRYMIPRVPLVWWNVDGRRLFRAKYPCQRRLWRTGCYAGVIILAACAIKPPAPLPAPEPVVRTVTVDRIVTQPCISRLPDLPMYSDTDMALGAISDDFDGAWNGIALLKGGRAQRNAYIDQLRAVLQACTAPAPR